MTEGTCYIFFVPPSWLLVGTVESVQDGVARLKNCVHVENVNSGHSTVSSLAVATTPKNWKDAIQSSWPWPDGTLVRLEASLITIPCVSDVGDLARRARSTAAVKGA